MRTPRRYPLALALALLAAACTNGAESTPVSAGTSANGEIVVGDTAPPDSPPPPPVCEQNTPVTRNEGGNPSIEFFDEGPGLASVHISQATFQCATQVVIVGDADLDRVALAANLAVAFKAPLLIGSQHSSTLLGFETERLSPGQVIAIGDDIVVTAPEWTEIVTLSGDTASLAEQINGLAGFTSSTLLPDGTGADTLATTASALGTGVGLAPPPATQPATTTSSSGADPTSTTAAPAPVTAEYEIPDLFVGTGETGVALLVDGHDPATALAAFASAAASGAVAALVDNRDLRAVPGAGRALQSMPNGAGEIQVFGELTTDSHWQLDVIRTAPELPGGGYLVLPRFLVALYGNPLTGALGVLGEQGPEESVTRIREIAGRFSESEAPVLPTFEIITTVAHASAGADADYSNEMGNEVIQPWIDIAEREGIYVVLDLQPGRSDFLSQAKQYEQELLNPHVGLALDPEWRLAPNQLHLQQVGRVEADEVNSVVQWLADLVRENNLPQKVLLLHQFREFMLQDRETIQARPEIQLVIQMDGFGTPETKELTWAILTEGWETHPWRWGWKNFFDEDTPSGGQTAEELFRLEPTVVYTSYQ